jgi:membrane protein insertase Oxa1/YidC/SpoIIIJ
MPAEILSLPQPVIIAVGTWLQARAAIGADHMKPDNQEAAMAWKIFVIYVAVLFFGIWFASAVNHG